MDGDLINSVVSWFGEVGETAQQKTCDFLEEKSEKIQKIENPKQVAKVAAEMKSLKELKKLLKKRRKNYVKVIMIQ